MRISQIQGLRALAAILVTLFHARLIPGGFIGVDIFYVISGYLITGLILRAIDQEGGLHLRNFYERRIKRLLPTSAFVLIATGIVSWFILPEFSRINLGKDLAAAALYISNYLFAWWQNDYQNLSATPSPVIHYWSLAVEEQFYLVWPFFILLLTKFSKRRFLVLGIFIMTMLSFGLSIFLTNITPIWAFYGLPTRAWELGAGALLLFIPERYVRAKVLPWLAMTGILISVFRFDEKTAFPGYNALLPVASTVLLIGTIKIWPTLFNYCGNSRIAQWLGAISYPLYLWHWPVLVLPSTALGRPLHIFERIACIALTIFLADITHRFIEQPLRHKNFSTKTIYLGAVGITCISVLFATWIITTYSNVITVNSPTPKRYSMDEVLKKPDVYGDGCQVNYGETESGVCTYGDLRSDKTIVLYGDSHAAQWFPALNAISKERGIKLISLTKSACPAVDSIRPDEGAFKMIHCTQWRKNSIQRIARIHPLAIITSSYQYFSPPSNYKDRNAWWKEGEIKLLSKLKGLSENIIYISDTPHPQLSVPTCLASRKSSSCDSTKKSPVVVIKGFDVIDPNPWLCSSFCPAIVDGVVAYRDGSHISVAMALALIPKLQGEFTSRGIL
jgi:peptidoglycan/LPS O-acetylase OafA/YrhL